MQRGNYSIGKRMASWHARFRSEWRHFHVSCVAIMNGVPSRNIPWLNLLIGALVAAAALIVVAQISGNKAQSAAPGTRSTLEFLSSDLLTVQNETFVRGIPITGTLHPLDEATLKAKVAGELIEVNVREGMAVKKGQVLARIDQTEVLARLAARDADVEAARAQLDLAGKNRTTQLSLVDRNFISRNAFDATQNAYDVALARLRSAEAERALARKSQDDAVLVAPINGVVSQRFAEPGERIGLDGRILAIVDLSRLEFEATLPSARIGEVRVGQKLSIRVEGAVARAFTGTLERINPATNAGSRSINVYAVIDNAGAHLRAGMFAQGAIQLRRIDNALVIPTAAIRADRGKRYVYIIDGNSLKRAEISPGEDDGAGRTQILSGIAPGDVIVKNNLGILNEAASVRILNRKGG